MGATSKPVARRYCDEPMARSKGLIGSKQTSLPKCKKK